LGLITAPTRLTVWQGEDLGRPSGLLVDFDPAGVRVKVTGQAVPVPAGELSDLRHRVVRSAPAVW